MMGLKRWIDNWFKGVRTICKGQAWKLRPLKVLIQFKSCLMKYDLPYFTSETLEVS